MYRVFRNIISQIIWVRKSKERERTRKREKRKIYINKVMPRVQERDRE